MKTILIGYDDSESARRALHRAVEYAQAFSARLVVMSVAPLLVGAGRGMGPIDPVSDEAEHERQLEAAKAAVAEYTGPGGSPAAEYVMAVGDPVDVIVEAAERHQADLIVVGTREPSLVARLLGQSVSAGVARHAHCDVLVVHAPH